MSFSEITRKIAGSLSGIFSSQGKKYKKGVFQPRRLHIDPLEERQLLAVNVVMPQEQTVIAPSSPTLTPTISSSTFFINGNNTYGGADYTETIWGNDYIASDNQGNTVIVWAQNDYVYQTDANGNTVRLVDRYGNYYDDYNVYAQYLTDQIDRVSIPTELLEDNISGKSGSFTMIYAPYEVQRLSIKTVTDTSASLLSGTGANVVMQFEIGGVDTDQDGVPNFEPVNGFSEYNSPAQNAEIIQMAIRNLGGQYADVIVTAESTKDFLITFDGTQCAGVNIPELEIRNVQVTSGNYAGVIMSTVSEPIVVTNYDSWGNEVGILVDPNDPETTAMRIQQAFDRLGAYSIFPRVETYTRVNTINETGNSSSPASSPSYEYFYTPEVTVSIVTGGNYTTGTTFDITFVCSAGLTVQELILVSALDEFGAEYVSLADSGCSVETVKQSSDIFRVNAPEENDPMSDIPLVTNQLNPSVAMDADGDFVITWQSEVSTTGNTVVTDIYARQFSPQGIVDNSKITFYSDGYTTSRISGGASNTPVQGVRPVGDQFKVNTFSNSLATAPSIGMDADGNFIIAWTTTYKSLGDGNSVYAKRYDRYGNALTDEIKISGEYDNFPLTHVSVTISDDGYAAITWIYNEDTNFENISVAGPLYLSLFAPGSLTPMAGFDRYVIASDAYNPSVAFSADNTLLITYTANHVYEATGTYSAQSADSMAQMFEFSNGTFTQLQGEFLIHGFNNWLHNHYADESWRGAQYNGIGGLDASGNAVFVYQGYGPDSNEAYPISIPGSYFLSYLNDTKNSDLLIYFDPRYQNFTSASSDVDVAIRDYLARAMKHSEPASYDQIARLNAILESVVGMMRGGANDIYVTTVDKGVWDNVSTGATISDANVTSTRDGVNSRWYIMIPSYSEGVVSGGTINLRLTREVYSDDDSLYSSESATISIALTTYDGVFTPGEFEWRLYCYLNSLSETTGLYSNNAYTALLTPIFGSGDGLLIPSAEVTYYSPGTYENQFGGTMWELPDYYYSSSQDINGYHIYEIIFVGGAHDNYVGMSFTGTNTLSRRDTTGNFIGAVNYFAQTYGYAGSTQSTPGLTVQTNGSYVVSWFTDITTTNGTVVDRKINYRYFDESSDNTGPKVTDVILPNGEYVANNDMITYSLGNLVITVDEELLANGANGLHSVLNPDNWAIIKDGVKIDVIESISFGVNQSRDMIDENSDLADSTLALGSNKWEVVITFSEPLTSGSYELVATNKLCDTSGVSYSYVGGKLVYTYNNGNALGSSGNNANGENFSRLFTINAIDGLLTFGDGTGVSYDDTLVSDMAGEHYTRTGEGNDTPGNPTSVASDEHGNFVTVWTEEGNGIWAKIYHQDFIETANGRESVITVYREFQVTTNPTASYASVAMDADGDFVVTWMQEDSDGRNIYAKAYNANGTGRTDSNGNVMSAFRVNAHSNGTHSYPDIAMDSDGSFVITWESLNQSSKNSGYDVYYQRYDSTCTPIGGVDEIQSIQFSGGISAGGVFRIEFDGQLTDEITIGANTTITAANIKQALLGLGLDVEVAAASSESIFVQFTNTMGSRDVVTLSVPTQYVKLVDPKSSQSISVSTMTTGTSGEARANDTTDGDQRYAAIAMGQGGEFIISWTSWGQGNDSAYESNIYAKNFASNTSVATSHNQVTLTDRIATMNMQGNYDKLIVSSDSPDNHLTGSSEYTGVVYIYVMTDDGAWVGSGSLLTSGMHILTAAHVVFDEAGSPVPAENIMVIFDLPSGAQYYSVSQNTVHASYTGNYTDEVDLAILTLSAVAPAEAERYDIYRGSDEFSSTHTIVGFGSSGTGTTGNVLPAGTRRIGENLYEGYGSIFNLGFNENTLIRDFDSGNTQNDAFGYYFNINNLGLGASREATSAGGDSGGPSFVSGKIAGVVSFGGTIYANSVTDVDNDPTNATFGEFSADVRVSAYADWIDSIILTGTSEYLVNETETGNQIWSDVAISMSGEVIFTWTSYNQDGAGDGPGGSSSGLAGVYARRFDMDGTAVSGVIGGEIIYDPESGDVIVTGNPVLLGAEFLVNNYIVGDQCYSSVSIANNGDFIIVWESYQDAHQEIVNLPDTGHGAGGTSTITVTDYGIYAKRYSNLSTLQSSRDNANNSQYGLPDNTRYVPGYGYVGVHGEIGSEFRVNKVNLVGDQTGATVAVNANGDAIVVFQSDSGDGTGSDVYYRAIPMSEDNSAPIVTETVAIVAEPDLDANGEVQYDADENIITKNEVLMTITDNSYIYGFVSQMVVTFSEEMYNAYVNDPKSILNTANWQLLKGGVAMYGAIVKVEFGLDKAYELGMTASKTGKWEAIVTFDSSIADAGNQPLSTGTYTLVVKQDATDLAENQLDGDYNGTAGGNFSRVFHVVTPALPGEEEDDDTDHSEGPGKPDEEVYLKTEFGNDTPAIASADDGSFVIVSVHYSMPGTPNEPNLPIYVYAEDGEYEGLPVDASGNVDMIGNIVLQRYDSLGNKVGTEQIVNNYMAGKQYEPEVAMDSYGNFAVVWAGNGSKSTTAIYCRLYDAYGQAVGDQFQVNTNNAAICSTPNVAYDDNGNILVTWVEYNTATSSYVVMYRIFNSNGVEQSVSQNGATASSGQKILVSETSRDIWNYDVAFDPNGNFIITWQMHNTATNSQDIFATVYKFTSTGSTQGTFNTTVARYIVNAYTTNIQARPSVATSSVGTFVISWASERQDGNEFGIFARRYDMSGNSLSILGKTTDAQINTTTVYSQDYPDVSMSANGNFVITWTSFDQEPNNYDEFNRVQLHDYGTFARAFNSGGTDLVTKYTPSTSTTEFRLNDTIAGNQVHSVVAIHDDGLSFAWIGDVYTYHILEYDDDGLPVEDSIRFFPTTEVYTRTYAVGAGSTESGRNSYTYSSYSATQQSGGGGYTGQGTATYKYDNLETLFLDGTDGDDVFEITVLASGAFQVKVNGTSQTVASNVKDIQVDGRGGNDKIIITAVNGDNTARINAGENRVTLSANDGSFVVSAYKVENAELNVGGLNNAVNLVATANDVLNVKVGELSLVGENHGYFANGFDSVTASATDKSAKAFLFDSAGDDTLTTSLGKAVMKGRGYEHTVSGFGTVSGYSTLGDDIAYLNGSAGNDAVFASTAAVSMLSSTYKNTASGFANVYVLGNGGTDSATIVGSSKPDRFTGTASYAEMKFGLGGTVDLYGFSNFNVKGNGGNDVISLSGVSLDTNASSGYTTYSSKTQTYDVTGFGNIRVQEASASTSSASMTASTLMATTMSAVTTEDVSATTTSAPEIVIEVTKVANAVTVQSNDLATANSDDELLQLLALEHYNSIHGNSEGDEDDDSLDIDYLLKIGAL